MNRLLCIFFIITGFSVGCNLKKSGDEGSNLPQSRSGEGEVLVIMDSVKWKGELGDIIRKTFSAEIPGLPQPEPYFTLKQIKPSGFRNLLRQASNVIIVMTLDNKSYEGEILRNYFTKESLDRIRSEEDIFMFTQDNVFARGQNVLYLYGQNDRQLYEHIRENQVPLRQYFIKNEKNRISAKIYGRSEQNLTRMLLRDYKFYLNIPANYELAKKDSNFVWIRQLGTDDKSIVVYYEPYTSEEVFGEEGILQLREKVADAYLFDIEKPSIKVVTETLIPLHLQRINMNGKYAIEARGLWKLSDNSLGGAFLSYVFVDESLDRLYYIEGFLSNPGRKKREPIRELEIILNSFRTQSEAGKSS